MSVLTLTGKPINWANPPKPTDKVLWSQRDTDGDKIIGSFRAICHLEDMQAKCVKRFKRKFRVIQPMNNKGVAASAGTHDEDFVIDADIPGVSWTDTNHFFRSNGHGGWVRTPAQGFSYHWHGFTLPPREGKSISDDFKVHGFKVGKYVDGGYSLYGRLVTSSQIADYYAKAFGLSEHHTPGSDKSWYPDNIVATIFDLPAFVARMAGNPVVPTPVKPPKTITAVAKEVIAGKWGDGDVRVKRLRAAGYSPEAVQRRVNALLAGGGPKPQPDAPEPVQPVSGALAVHGVDISHHQSGVLSFAKAKDAGVRWVYHKATEGSTYRDPNYAKRRASAKRAKVPFGAYHFARPSAGKGDATAEARFFLATAKPVPGDLRPCLDIEVADGLSVGQVQSWVAEFSAVVKKAIGVKPVIYTQSSWDLGKAVEDTHVIWRARYNSDNRPPVRRWDIHQFSNGVLGKPNTVPGFGHVDLNYMRPGLHTADLLIPLKPVVPVTPTPQPEPVGKDTTILRMAEVSMQFSDNPQQMAADVEVLFSRGYHVIAGTEAGPGADPLSRLLAEACKRHGYRLSLTGRYDTWVAVHESIIKGGWEKGSEFALWRSSRTQPTPPGRWGDKGVVWAEWFMGPKWGTMSVGSIHALTHGGAGPTIKTRSDKVYADVFFDWAEEHSLGDDIALIAGDFNLLDRKHDLAQGHPMRSNWDDLKTWPNTGHGNIDAYLRLTSDKRVKFVRARVLDDKGLFLNTDHFLVECDVQITALS